MIPYKMKPDGAPDSRGVRNNNPGNIRLSPTKWQGEVMGEDEAFETFESPAMGIRAMAKILLNYQRVRGLKTVRQLIDRWAPPVENDSTSYAMHVAKFLDTSDPDREVILGKVTLPIIVGAVILHENGYQPYAPALIIEVCNGVLAA